MFADAPDEIAFHGQVIEWRGPAPVYFVGISVADARALHTATKKASYGWGCVPVVATIGATEFRTVLFARNDSRVLPLKAAVGRPLEVVPVEAVFRIVPPRQTDHRR